MCSNDSYTSHRHRQFAARGESCSWIRLRAEHPAKTLESCPIPMSGTAPSHSRRDEDTCAHRSKHRTAKETDELAEWKVQAEAGRRHDRRGDGADGCRIRRHFRISHDLHCLTQPDE